MVLLPLELRDQLEALAAERVTLPALDAIVRLVALVAEHLRAQRGCVPDLAGLPLLGLAIKTATLALRRFELFLPPGRLAGRGAQEGEEDEVANGHHHAGHTLEV